MLFVNKRYHHYTTMSTFLKSNHFEKIRSREDLKLYFQQFSKSDTKKLIGIECELLAVHKITGKALPYEGKLGIECILNELSYQFGYEKIMEEDNIIGLKKGSRLIALEPGGQIELSGEPVRTVHEVKSQLDEFCFELKTIAGFLNEVAFLAYGVQPFSDNSEIEWVPKKRYQIMAKHMGSRGKLSHDMMKRTASNQVSFDYTDEQDAFEKMCLVMRLTPIAYAIFANSSFSKGKVNEFVTERLHIWRQTDPDRSGLITDILCPNASFDHYLDYLLKLPMMFLVRGNKWIQVERLTFGGYLEKGYQGHHATLEDFELHLSTAFPEARFKQYLEIRSADGQRRHLIPAVAAFWKGILYDRTAEKAASNVIKSLDSSDYAKLYSDVAKKGLHAKVKGASVLELARELVKISENGLAAHREFNENEEDERVYLEALRDEVLQTGETEAERLVRFWNTSFRKDRKTLIEYLSIG